MKDYFFFSLLYHFIKVFSIAFVILYIINTFGAFKSGILIGIFYLVSTSFDFFSGVISDHIGQKSVLIASGILISIFYLGISLFNGFFIFIILMVIRGLANALDSGALYTWFINNYKISVQNLDSDRKIYSFIDARIRMMNYLSTSLSVFIGANVVYYFSQNIAFQVTALLFIITIILLFFLLKENIFNQDADPEHQLKPEERNIKHILLNSIKYIFQKKELIVFIVAYLIWLASFGFAFGDLIFYTIKYGYTGNAQLFGLLQSLTGLMTVITVFIVSLLIKRIRNSYIIIATSFYNIIFYTGLILLMIFIPLSNEFSLVANIAILLLILVSDAFFGEIGVNLINRFMVDLVPSEYRNSIIR